MVQVFAQIGNQRRWFVGNSFNKPTNDWIRKNTGIDTKSVHQIIWHERINAWVIKVIRKETKHG